MALLKSDSPSELYLWYLLKHIYVDDDNKLMTLPMTAYSGMGSCTRPPGTGAHATHPNREIFLSIDKSLWLSNQRVSLVLKIECDLTFVFN